MQYRIGDRDPVTGLYDVIHPDGSFTRNGIKIFNSAHEFGDVVLATQRSDGMMILDGVKATLTEVVTNSFGLGGFGEKPVGYLNGQVFNNEDEVILPTVLIEFAPGSPTELEPNAGDFVLRIKINRPQRRDLRVKCELSGTAASGDYTIVGLNGDLIAAIPAGADYFDVAITPTQNQSGSSQTVVVKIIQDRVYRVGQNDSATATILNEYTPPPVYRIFRSVGISSGGGGVVGGFSDSVVIGGRAQDVGKKIVCKFESVDFAGNPVTVTGANLVIDYALFGAQAGINYVAPPGTTVLPFATVGKITIPIGYSAAELLIDPIISPTSNGSLGFGIDTTQSYYPVNGVPYAAIISPSVINIYEFQAQDAGGTWNPISPFNINTTTQGYLFCRFVFSNNGIPSNANIFAITISTAVYSNTNGFPGAQYVMDNPPGIITLYSEEVPITLFTEAPVILESLTFAVAPSDYYDIGSTQPSLTITWYA